MTQLGLGEGRVFTPRHAETDERLFMKISPEDAQPIRRGEPWQGEVTDLLTGTRWLAEGAECSLRCFCDAIVRPIQ